MKYSSKMYAEVLVDSVLSSPSTVQTKKRVTRFLDILFKNGDIKKAREIILLAEGLWHQKTGYKKIVVESARPIKEKSFLKNFVTEGDMVMEKINPAIIAGIKVMVNGEKQLDFSLLKKLDEIFT